MNTCLIKKRGGYNRRSRSEHPGVRILKSKGKCVLRYRDSFTGRDCQSSVYDANNLPITTRERAKAFAIEKSNELLAERHANKRFIQPNDAKLTWKELQTKHNEHLDAKGRSKRTKTSYRDTWNVVHGWMARPKSPYVTTIADLEQFVRYLRAYRRRLSRSLSCHSIATIARHLKAILNFGRKYFGCVRLDAEQINLGLDVGTLPKLTPVVLSTHELRSILIAAINRDKANSDDHPIFPYFAFLMLTGCRRGEAAHLRWTSSAPKARESWCDLSSNRLLIWGKKTQRQRVVPLKTRPNLKRILSALRSRVDIEVEPFVFGGKRPLGEVEFKRMRESGRRWNNIKDTFRDVEIASQVEYTFKDFRSTLATYMANSELGQHLYTLADELGHSYPVLVKHYASRYPLPESQEKAVDVETLLGIGDVIDEWLGAENKGLAKIIQIQTA